MLCEERRDLAAAAAGVQLRADGDRQRFEGLASPAGVRAPIGNPRSWGFFEEFAPGAFTDSLAERDQRMLIDHESYYVVSRVSAGTLRLSQSTRGLEVDSDLDAGLSYIADLVANLRNGNITGMSIGFLVPPGGAEWQEIEVEEPRPDGRVEVYTADLRIIRRADLVEVSAVTFPAFVDTEASLRYAVAPALNQRGDADAIARRAQVVPQLAGMLTPAPTGATDRVPAARSVADVTRIMRGYATRYRLPR